MLFLTLWPIPEAARQSRLTPIFCLVCGDLGMQDVLQNILMLLPLGFGLGLAGWRVRRATMTGFALAFAVELLQYTVVPGRDASLSDVVTNTLGAALGAWLGMRFDALLRPAPRAARRLALAAVGGWAALWLAGAWLLGASPGPAPWHAMLQPEMIDAPPFAGRVLSATLGRAPLLPGWQAVPAEFAATYARDSFAFAATVVMPPSTGERTGLLELRDGDSTVQASVRERAGSVRFAMRTRSSQLRLRPIAFRVAGSAPVRAGDTLLLGIRRDGGTIVVSPRRAGEREVRADIGPHWLATLLLPLDAQAGPGWEIFAYAWVAALLLAAGWWVAHAPPAERLTLAFAAFAIVIAGLRSVPSVFHLSHTSVIGWIAACGALAAGLLLGRVLEPAT